MISFLFFVTKFIITFALFPLSPLNYVVFRSVTHRQTLYQAPWKLSLCRMSMFRSLKVMSHEVMH